MVDVTKIQAVTSFVQTDSTGQGEPSPEYVLNDFIIKKATPTRLTI